MAFVLPYMALARTLVPEHLQELGVTCLPRMRACLDDCMPEEVRQEAGPDVI